MTVKEHIAGMLQQKLPALDLETVMSMLEIPPEKNMGDYAFPCFRLAPRVWVVVILILSDEKLKMFNAKLLILWHNLL